MVIMIHLKPIAQLHMACVKYSLNRQEIQIAVDFPTCFIVCNVQYLWINDTLDDKMILIMIISCSRNTCTVAQVYSDHM